MKTDVLVVGGGPVGLVMASELARYGVSVRIIEQAAKRTDKSKALVLWSRTLELMDRMGCTANFLAQGRKASGATVSSGAKEIAHIALGGVATPYPFALMLVQNETERLLEQHLNTLGVKLERSVELVKFTASTDGVISTLRYIDGREETLETSWLIGCDGAHSTVRHQLGMEFIGDTMPSDWILADAHLTGVQTPDEIKVFWHSDGVLAIFPITDTRFRVIADIAKNQGPIQTEDPTLELVQAILDRRGPAGIQVSDPVWLAGFHINERKVAEYRAGRVFLAGDAAHIHSPAGGQGMNTGIQDACNLAWKLSLACRGLSAEEPLLDSYSIERSAVGDQVLEGAGRLTAVAIMTGGVKQSIRNHLASLIFGLAPIRDMAANALSEVSIGYPKSPLTARGAHIHGGPVAGERAPIRGDEPPVGAGGSPRFALFADAVEESSRLIARYSHLLESDLRNPYHEGGIWLVRPDGYVALATGRNGWDGVSNYLDRITNPNLQKSESAAG
jgi:2-polyprenyl-6-methoxyphenol hydroxylase-like FAD-dependent oxidoreductase